MDDVRNKVCAALFCVLLTVVHTWPLASAPATLSRNDNADNALNTWIIAWVAHQLPRDPLHLFDANIFYPEPRTLAFSEPLIVPALMVAPVLWVGGSAVLAYNLALLAGMALTAFAGYLLALRFTRDNAAGLVAATLVAFNALTLTNMPQIQIQHGYGILFALLGFDLLLTEPRRRRGAVMLGASVLALALTSGYMTVLGLTALASAAAWRWRELAGARHAGARRRLALAALATSALVGVLLSPYWLVHVEQGLTRVPATPPTAIAASYLATGARLHYAVWSEPFSSAARVHLFAGLVPSALAAYAMATGRGRYLRRRIGMLAAIGAVGVFFSFGASNPVYMLLYRLLPPLQGLRIVARFGLLLLLAVALLAAIGFAALRRRHGGGAGFVAATIVLLVAINLEVLRAPRPYEPFEGIPAIYDMLAATSEDAVLVEFPFPPARSNGRNAAYMLASTRHWRRLLNGYSGFVPMTYRRRAESLAVFPEGNTLDELLGIGVTHIMIHTRGWSHGAAAAERLERERRLVLADRDQEGRYLFAVRR
jgi:hypothetical protein